LYQYGNLHNAWKGGALEANDVEPGSAAYFIIRNRGVAGKASKPPSQEATPASKLISGAGW
jgi:hypothetical protein